MSEVHAKDTSLCLLVTSVFPAAKIFNISQIRQKTRWARILPRGGRKNDKAGNRGRFSENLSTGICLLASDKPFCL